MTRLLEGLKIVAIALALLGHPIARAVMPLAAVVSIAAIGWRNTYVVCAILAVFVMLPLVGLLTWLLPDIRSD